MGQVPFLRLLFPFICGILFCKYISPSFNTFIVAIIGLAIILISFFAIKRKVYGYRWVFGLGLLVFMFSISAQYYQYRLAQVSYNFPNKTTTYIGTVLDIPQPKKRSVACKLQLTYPIAKKIMIYLEPDTLSSNLAPGDELLVHANIKPFKNLGNPDDFDYKGFMQNKGFSGSAYASSIHWTKTGGSSNSIKSKALRLRAKILGLYKSFDLDDDSYALISALTLGYKADLSDGLKETFRASGTSHVLAVSGLHVGVVYVIIISFFSLLGRRRKVFFIRQILVLLCLWGYVFITGMPVSVVRAAIMLSLVCIGGLFNKEGFTYNTLAIAASIILVINPFYLFDVGFQLSFTAVLAILFFQPKLSKLYTPSIKGVDFIWNLFTVSFAAQLGVFPLVLYYFGTFPTYFFITNMLVLPLIAIIIYSTVLLTSISLLSFLNLGFLKVLYSLMVALIQFLVNVVLQIVHFFESLPFSSLEGNYISALQVFLIFAIMLSFSHYILQRYTGMLIAFLASVALLLSTYSVTLLRSPVNQFVVYNSYTESDIGYKIDGQKIVLPVDTNQTVAHPQSSIVLLTENNFKSKTSTQLFSVDFLILTSDNSFSISELNTFFRPGKIIADPSIARYAVVKMQKECDKLNIPFHDISKSGAFVVNF